jgi:hypothetical protein
VHGGDLGATGGAEVGDGSRHDLAGRAGATFGDEALRAERARYGRSPVNVEFTSLVPPKIGVCTVTESPSTVIEVELVSTVRSSLTDRRDITSRPS